MKRQKRQINGKNSKLKTTGNSVIKTEKNNVPAKTAKVSQLVCFICESSGANITCSGVCMESFHLDCIGKTTSKKFQCDSCLSDKHPCFWCKKSEGSVRKCSVSTCGKFYHGECLQKLHLDKDKFTCPLHSCLTCNINDKKNTSVIKSQVLQCFRCPTAYHNRNDCMVAGCKQLSECFIICPDHFVPAEGKLFQSVANIPWCFVCAAGGALICCESCPAAVHATCLQSELVGDNYVCYDCISRKHVHYGSIVWVKIGSFRWWPARILDPKDLPSNMQGTGHSVGEFPVQYFGTKEYFWTHKGRVYPYFCVQEDSVVEITKHPSVLEAKYKMSIQEANTAFDKWVEENVSKEVAEGKPRYKHIKTNRPVGKVQINTADISSLARCICNPESSNPCGYNSGCLNRSVCVECYPSVCKAGEQCQNQMFQKRQYAKVAPFKTKTRGWALKALEDIKEGHFIIEYVGDLIDEEECQRRLIEKCKKDDTNYYFLTIDKDRIIDAGPRGNFSRFMNHSCSPNCETQKWIVNGDTRVGLFAKHDIVEGSELTFDYMMDSLDNEKLKCLCGVPNCRGAIGVKTQNPLTKSEQKKEKLKQKLRSERQNQQLKLSNKKPCFLCNKTGKLVVCNLKGCLKSYHISCLGRESIPVGRWQCPWHHCDTCGRLSKYMCSKCTNSFCERHRTDENMSLISDSWLCSKHANDNCSEVLINSVNGD